MNNLKVNIDIDNEKGGLNDLKFCMQGAFACLYWILVKLRSHSLYIHLLSVKHVHSTPKSLSRFDLIYSRADKL